MIQSQVDPIYRLVRRPWRERLFTRPWRPLLSTRRERDFDAEREIAAELRKVISRADAARFKVPVARDWTITKPMPPAPRPPAEDEPDRFYDDSRLLLQPFVFSGSPPPAPAPVEAFTSGGGGDFAGAGASGSWDTPSDPPVEAPATDPPVEAPADPPADSSSSDSSSSDSSCGSSDSSD